MTVEELIKELKKFKGYYQVTIQYPNDDQGWEPYLTLYSGNSAQGDIYLDGDKD